MKRTFLATTTALAAALFAAPLCAQSNAADAPQASDQSSGGLDEIVVTAQRRAESIQDVPIAISAFSADQLRNQGVTSTLELGRFVPNLVSMNNTGVGSANAFYLRGLGNTETIPTFDPPVGTYVDDIYLSRQNANNINLFDVERVEVLRGPQGTLFGRNTTGGAVNVILKEAGKDFGGFVELGYGRYNKRVARGSVDIPVVDTLSVKLSGYYQNDDGYAKNVTTGQRVNDDDGWGARLGIHGDLSDTVRWNSSYAHIVANGENILNFQCNPANPSECDGRFVTTGLRSGKTAATSVFTAPVTGRKANFLMGNRTATDLVTSNLEIDLADKLTLNVITGFVNQTQQYALDFYDGRTGPSLANPTPAVLGVPSGSFVITNDGKHNQFSQEFKLNGSVADGLVDFVAGGFYLIEENKTDFADLFYSTGLGRQILLADRTLNNKTEAYAGYVQADVNVTEKLKLTAGVRYTDETKTLQVRDNRASCNDGTIEASCLETGNLVGPSGLAIPSSQSAKLWTPRFAINYKVNNDILLFTSATRGFKSGGWNARATTVSSFLPFGPEKVWSYEAGLKSEWFDRRVRANITFFYTDVQDLQTPSALVAPNGSATFITRNFADMTNKGIEAELTFVPVNGLNLYVNAGYQDAKFKIDRNAPDLDEYGIQSVNAQQKACLALIAAGNVPGGTGTTGACAAGVVRPDGSIGDPNRTPKITLAFGGTYELELGNSGMTLVPSVNASYRSSQETNAANFTIYSGAITGTNGTYPSNPYSGDEILNGSFSPSAWFVNAGLALNGADKKWQFSVSCSNCLNETAANTSLANTRYIDAPMTWIARARYNF